MLNNSIKYLEKLFQSSVPDVKPDDTPETFTDRAFEPLFENESISGDTSLTNVSDVVRKQGRVDSLIWAFREVGYIYGQLNPLGNDYQEHYTNLPLIRKGIFETLTPEAFELSPDDMSAVFYGGPALNHEKKTLSEILEVYSRIYCSSVGIEFLHIQNNRIRKWFIRNLETSREQYRLSSDEKKIILKDLIATEEFEHFLHKNYIGQKRFSIEGAEAVIPCLHFLVNQAVAIHVEYIVIGTTHRGRLAILNNILQLPPEDIFYLFEENFDPEMVDGGGDVKYHIGYSTEHVHDDGSRVKIILPPNSSHLESVDPVVQGHARGLQDAIGRDGKDRVIPVLIHGEAAFSGQGVAAETLNLAGLEGYSTGGTIHIIINNQVGFTASVRSEHSSSFATDIAKSVACPIVHVNGDEPETVVRVMKLAIEYRQTFKSDIVIDIICYRKYGHNEGDDPSFTHPRMYELIKNHKSVAAMYSEYCIHNGIATLAETETIRREYIGQLETSLGMMHRNKDFKGFGGFTPHRIKYFDQEMLTKKDVGISIDVINTIADKIHAIPDHFKIHDKLKRILETRYKLFKEKGTVDWALAESIAFASLLLEGQGVRLSGQDSERGTFSQRHLVWWEGNVDEPKYFIPLNHMNDNQAFISVYDSPLSEYSILGFELGYSVSRPDNLVMWEAQFGDFANGAQVIIDNYIIASEAKWNIRTGLVLLLPHGYEGQGPEHSNGHMDRFLQLCAQENIQVCNATTPAQYFCLLRRQVMLNVEKPLIIMTPKSLLRHPLAISAIDDLEAGHFQFVIDEPDADADSVSMLLFCTGKIYYELFLKRAELKNTNTVIIRIEQLYPFPRKEIEKILEKYGHAAQKYWIQEEPQNRGAWTFIRYQFESISGIKLGYIGRNPSASPATGSLALFKAEQQKILDRAFG
jgi:2-oxoglutarate dehydrogenase E1 component